MLAFELDLVCTYRFLGNVYSKKLHFNFGDMKTGMKTPSAIREMCVAGACADPTSPGVWWRDDTEWKQYDDAMAAAIQQGITDRARRVELGTLVSSKHGRGAQYVVDLTTMKQTNVATGFTRDVKVVKAPSAGATAPSDDVAALKNEVQVCQESIRSLKETVYKLEAGLVAVQLVSKEEGARIMSVVDHVCLGVQRILDRLESTDSDASSDEVSPHSDDDDCPSYSDDDDYPGYSVEDDYPGYSVEDDYPRYSDDDDYPRYSDDDDYPRYSDDDDYPRYSDDDDCPRYSDDDDCHGYSDDYY